MSLGKLIGRGNTAEVYEILDNKVLKLFFERMPYEYILKEYETAKIINDLDIQSPIVKEILKYDNNWGIIYGKISGMSFTQLISSQPFLLRKNASFFAELQASFHTKSTSLLMPQKEYLNRNITGTELLSKEEKEKILNYLKQLPEDNKVCHGDYHPDNIILMNGEPKVLDWMTGTSGNPCGDVARTLIILRYSVLPPSMPKITKFVIQTVRKVFANLYFNAYKKITNNSSKHVEQWFLPIMAARLVEEVPETEKKLLLEKIREKLKFLND